MRKVIAFIIAILFVIPLQVEVSASSLSSLESIHSEGIVNNDETVTIKQI